MDDHDDDFNSGCEPPVACNLYRRDGQKCDDSAEWNNSWSKLYGVVAIDGNVGDGTAVFDLATDALVDSLGNKGNTISNGRSVTVDATAPQRPANVAVQ